jgi:hypothetical protein
MSAPFKNRFLMKLIHWITPKRHARATPGGVIHWIAFPKVPLFAPVHRHDSTSQYRRSRATQAHGVVKALLNTAFRERNALSLPPSMERGPNGRPRGRWRVPV